jgi:membrane-associated protease RseP (regulator of RpoE activity)
MADKSTPSEDYPFRYQLMPETDGDIVYQDPLTEMIRAQLANILNIVVPVSGGKEVKVDGFKLLRDRNTTYRVFARESDKEQVPDSGAEASSPTETYFQDARNAALYEPRIEYIKAQLESLLSVVELEKDGKAVEVEGFRLKNLKDWLVLSNCDPIEVFGYAGARCDADCIFCYNKGNPQSLAPGVLERPSSEEWQEMETRLKYFSPRSGLSLFPCLGDTYEILIHPRIMEVLRKLRQKTPAVFRITTGGTRLTPTRIRQLAKLQPVYLYLSLNSASPSRRRKLMKDNNPQVAIKALPLLREQRIPYATVIVPWPVDSVAEMLDDLSSTVVFADENDTHIIQINLPGYSKYFSTEKLYDLDEVWSAVIARVRKLREKVSAPIVVMPSMAEENRYEGRKNRAKIIGLVKNSPAERGGLRKGDEILELGGLAVASRPQARQLLAALQDSKAESANISVKRGGRKLNVTVNLHDFSYPYSESVDRHLGIVMMGTGFRLGCLEKLREVIDIHKAKRVLFLSSTLVKPSFEQALGESALFASGEVEIDIQVPRNDFFGGNIFMGDLLVVQDFIDYIKEYLEKGGRRPELIVIPSSPFNLGQWKRDLTGRVYLDIEREVGIPVELLDCETIYD